MGEGRADIVFHTPENRVFVADLKKVHPATINTVRFVQRESIGVIAVDQLTLFDETVSDVSPPDSVKDFPAADQIDNLFSTLMSRDLRHVFIGDLQERYASLLKSNGRTAASVWLWKEVFNSFVSLALDCLKRISGLERLYRRIGS